MAEARKYNRRVDFKDNSRCYYYAALNRGKPFFEKVCAHMQAKPGKGIRWTKERVIAAASNFTSPTYFNKFEPSAYQAMQRLGIENLACGHMCRIPKKTTTYTYAEVEQVAKLFKSKTEFKEKAHPVYKVALKMGWIDSVCSHMSGQFPKWDKESVLKIAKNIEFSSDFTQTAAYKHAQRLGIVKEAKAHMKKTRPTITQKMVRERAKDFQDEESFKTILPCVYGAGLRFNIIDELFPA